MDEATLNNFLLLQQTPFYETYGITLTRDFFHRASAPERMLALHFLCSVLDPRRCKTDFAGSIYFLSAGNAPEDYKQSKNVANAPFYRSKSESLNRRPAVAGQTNQRYDSVYTRTYQFVRSQTFYIINIAYFRHVLYYYAIELYKLAGFELPSSAEFCNSNSRNLKMLYCTSRYLVRMRSYQLIQELGDAAPFHTLHVWQGSADSEALGEELCSEVHKSAEEWRRIKDIAKAINALAREADEAKIASYTLNELHPQTYQGLSKLEAYIRRISTYSGGLERLTPNIQELMYLQNAPKQGIVFSQVLYALDMTASRALASLNANACSTEIEVDYENVQRLYELKSEVQAVLRDLERKFETAQIRYIYSEQKKKVQALYLQHYSQVEHDIDLLSEINLSQLSYQSSYVRVSVLGHSVVDYSGPVTRSTENVLETRQLTLEDRPQKASLAYRLRYARALDDCEVIDLIGGQKEGVREYLRIQ